MPTLAPLARRRGNTPAPEAAPAPAPARQTESRSSTAVPRYLSTQAVPAEAELSALQPPEQELVSSLDSEAALATSQTPPASDTEAPPAQVEQETGIKEAGEAEAKTEQEAKPDTEPSDGPAEDAAPEETEAEEPETAGEDAEGSTSKDDPETQDSPGDETARESEAPADAEIPTPAPPELGGILAKVIPLPPVMSRERRLDILARTGKRPEAHHDAVRQRLGSIAERANHLQGLIVSEARLAAAGAMVAFTTKADAVPGMIASAEERVSGAYAGARERVRDAADQALATLDANQGESTASLDTSSLSMEAQIQRVLASGSPAIKQLHQEQLGEVDKALKECADSFHTVLDPKEQAIRNSPARHLSTGAPTMADAGRTPLAPEVPWGEMLPARQEAEVRAWPARAGQQADDVKRSIANNAAMILGQREAFSVAILRLLNPAAVQLEEVTQHESGQVCAAGSETRHRVATDHERAVNTVSQFRDRAFQQLEAGEKGALKELRAIGRRLESDIRLRARNLDGSIGETARDLAAAYRTQMAGVNESIDAEGFLDEKQTEPLLAGAALRFEEMYAEQSASLAATTGDAVGAVDAAIEGQTRAAVEIADNSQAEAGKLAGEHASAIGEATDAFGRALMAPTTGTVGTASPYTATASEALGRRPEQVRAAVAQMIATTRTTLDTTLKSETTRVQGLVNDLPKSLRGSVVADGLAKISDLNSRVRDAYKAMAVVGTEESDLLGALHNLTAIQGQAMEAIWRNRIPARRLITGGVVATLRDWLDDELSGDDYRASIAYLEGRTADGARFELEASMSWYGDDEARIERVLRDLQQEPPTGGHINALKNTDGWAATHARLQSNLGGTDLDVTNALLAGNKHRADALRLREDIEAARRQGDADKVHKLLEKVPANELAAVRREFAAAERGFGPDVSVNITDAEAQTMFVDFVTRDREVLDPQSARYGGPATRTVTLTAPNRSLAVALATRSVNAQGEEGFESRVAVRAARMDVEVHRRGDKNLENLQRGFEYDQASEINDELTSTNPAVVKLAERRRDEARAVRTAAMHRFAAQHGGLENASTQEVQAYTAGVVGNLFSSDEGRQFGSSMVEKGFADPAAAMRLAVEGRGTDEDLIKRTLGRLDADQIAELKETYRTRYHEDLDQRLGTNQPRRDQAALAVFAVSPILGAGMMAMPGGELSGDDRLEVELLLRGRPRNDRERYALEMARVEQQRTETGAAGKALMRGSVDESLMNDGNRRMVDIVDRAGGIEKAFDQKTGRFIGSAPTADEDGVLQPNQEEGWAFGEELKWNQFGAESYQAGIDRVTNFLATALAVIAAVVVSILIPGVGGAIAGAIIGGLLSMATKAAIKGGRYGWEEAAVDLAVTAVDALTAGLTHGLGEALRGAGAAARTVATRGAVTVGRRAGLFTGLAARGRKAATYVATEGLENFVGSVPSAFTGQVLNEQNWKGGSPFTNILKGTFMEAGISAGVGLGMSGAMSAGGALKSIRGSLRERAMRASVLESIPKDMRHAFSDVPMIELPSKQFDQFGSRSGQAVTVITPDGPVIYLREGASPRALREEGIHLMQSREAQWSRQITDLSEANLVRWHEMSLGEQVSLYRHKLDLEIDAQRRLLLDLGDELALAGPLSQRGLRRQMREVEAALDNLQRRRLDVERISPERMDAVAGGTHARPDYLDQPPRLFMKKAKRPERGKKADAETRRTELPVEPGHPDYSPLTGRSDITGTVVEIGPRWVEPNGREYRLVGVIDEAGRLTNVRQEIRSAHEGERWVQRGSESAKRGRLAESASQRMSAGEIDPNWPTTKSVSSQWNDSGRGFDEVLLDFRLEGNELVARVRVVEVKDYPGRYVPLDSFTAIRPPPHGNLDQNLKFIDDRLRDVGTLDPPGGLGLTETQVRAARKALKRNVELEIRKTPETDIGERDAGSVLKEIEAEWKRFNLPGREIRVRDIGQAHINAAKAAETAAAASGKSSRQALRERSLRLEFERSIPSARRSAVSDVPIIEVPPAKFREVTGSNKGDAVTFMTDDGPVVWLRQGADPRVLREEGIHVLQSRERTWAKRIAELRESNLARWHEMPLAEQLTLYRTKLEVEIDAHQRLLRDLSPEVEAARGVSKRALVKQLREAQEALANLGRRLDEVNGLSKTRIKRMAQGREARPAYLDQPPRLFAKRGRKGADVPRGPDGSDEYPGAKLERLVQEQESLEAAIARSHTEQAREAGSGRADRAQRIEEARAVNEARLADIRRQIPAEIEAVLPHLARALDLDLPELIAGIKQSVKAGRRLDAEVVVNSLRNRFRKRPRAFGPLEGAISREALELNVIAIQQMREKIAEFRPDAVLAVERGGALLAEALGHGQPGFPTVHPVEKFVTIGADGRPSTQRTPLLEQRIRHLIESRQQSHFAIVDVYMGGHFSGELKNMIERIVRDHSHVRFDVMWLRETAGFERSVDLSRKFSEGVSPADHERGVALVGSAQIVNGKVKLTRHSDGVIVPAPEPMPGVRQTEIPVHIAVGDDMDTTVFDPNARGPLRIFDRQGRIVQEIKVPTIDPVSGERLETVRAVLIRLLQGVQFPPHPII